MNPFGHTPWCPCERPSCLRQIKSRTGSQLASRTMTMAMTATPRVLLGNSVARTARKDNGIKSSKMKRKRQIMLRDLNWIRRRVWLCGCQLALAVKPFPLRTRTAARLSWHQFCHLMFFTFFMQLSCFVFYFILFCFVCLTQFVLVKSTWLSVSQVFDGIHPICSLTAVAA